MAGRILAYANEFAAGRPRLSRPAGRVLVYTKKKRGNQPSYLIANILKTPYDRIAWKLVDFCNIKC